MTRPQLILMRGISGSGKSTLAKHLLQSYNNTITVSRDDLRLALYNTAFGPPIDENFITTVEFDIINRALNQGTSVICDNTHLTPRAVDERINLAVVHYADFFIREVEVPLHLAKSRNVDRQTRGERFVPENVLETQHENFYQHRDEIRELVQRVKSIQ